MAAPIGNEFWKLAPTTGRKVIWEDPEELRSACEEYFQFIVDNPLKADNIIAYEGAGYHEPLDKMRTMSIQGLTVFLGIVRQTWNNYRDKEDFLVVCEYVESVMYDYKLTGASAGLLNPSIVQRDIGLVDKKETDLKTDNLKIQNNWQIHPVTTKSDD